MGTGDIGEMGMERLDIKRHAERAFDQVLKAFDKYDRDPEPREQEALVDALCCIASRQYVMATAKILEVAKSIHLPSAARARQAKVNRDVLRRALTHVRIHR
jgi:hypothetical protein